MERLNIWQHSLCTGVTLFFTFDLVDSPLTQIPLHQWCGRSLNWSLVVSNLLNKLGFAHMSVEYVVYHTHSSNSDSCMLTVSLWVVLLCLHVSWGCVCTFAPVKCGYMLGFSSVSWPYARLKVRQMLHRALLTNTQPIVLSFAFS